MPKTEDVLNAAVAGLDDDLKPIEGEGKKEEPKTPPKEKPAEKPENKKAEPPEEEFTAKEVVREDAPTTKVETAPVVTDGLSEEGKYIVDNLPTMTARIKDGDGIKELQVKSWTQLPEDVEFATKRDELSFMNSLTAQENRANTLQNQFRQTQQSDQVKKFEQQEEASVWDDVAELQDEGLIGKFTGPKDNPTFKTEADAERVEAVIKYKDEQNQLYLDMYNQGRPYKHIGFKEAYYMYDRKNPTTPPAQKKEDQNRQEVAEHLNVNRGLAAKEFKRPIIKRGTRLQDIMARIDSQEEL